MIPSKTATNKDFDFGIGFGLAGFLLGLAGITIYELRNAAGFMIDMFNALWIFVTGLSFIVLILSWFLRRSE